MSKKKGLTAEDLKRISDAVGKKGKNGKPTTVKEAQEWLNEQKRK